jgi:ferredoxin--NADP+ reductase
MTFPGTPPHTLRVAVVGAGPAGFFLAEKLLGQAEVPVHVDLYERLPTPYGLVRFGVAPDHEKIKNVTRQFDKTAARPGFRFFGNVDVGRDVSLEELRCHYHQICFATGAQTDRHMGIPGEALARSHPATEFVAWYNGHPEFTSRTFDLSVERVAVVGVGNVAVDVARMLCRTPEELATTDVAPYALEALRESRVREVYLLGRRGPVQAAFTNPEVKELGELPGADIRVLPEEVALDPVSQSELDRGDDHSAAKKVEILRQFSTRPRAGRPRLLTIRFLVSPVEILADEHGGVRAMRLVRNRLVAGQDGAARAEPTTQFEELPVGLVFRSVGYRGLPIPGLPFDEKAGVVPNQDGRVAPGLYVAGWIKRGPTGVIGTNKPDAGETATAMLADARSGVLLSPSEPAPALEFLLRRRQPALVTFADWQRLDRLETARGRVLGRPRLKFTSVAEMLTALEPAASPEP